MPGSKRLLDEIEAIALRGEHIAVVRILNIESGESSTVTVNNRKLTPPLSDQKLTAQILAATENLTSTGGTADLVECLNEQGTSASLAIEIVRPKHDLLVFGGGHVGQAVALIGALIGYDVTVVDDRAEFVTRQRLPDPRINLLVSDYGSASQRVTISSGTIVVIVTRGHQHDETCLKSVVGSNAAYIGMIGSRRRVLSVFKKLVTGGVPEQDLQRVHAPIGLRIGAKTPQEIAVSILAEVIGHVNNTGPQDKGEQ
jgi:xanthine dehydrogenase accessory factor